MIRKVGLISKFMTSQPGSQTIAIHILPNISQSKGNQTIKFGQLIVYNKRNHFCFKNYAENEAKRLVPGLYFQASSEVKARGLQLSFNTFR